MSFGYSNRQFPPAPLGDWARDRKGDTALNLTLVLYHLAADYHSGMSSRGYRLLCACQRRLRRRGGYSSCLFPEERKLYAQLATKYGDRL
jgi:hypothetical protein